MWFQCLPVPLQEKQRPFPLQFGHLYVLPVPNCSSRAIPEPLQVLHFPVPTHRRHILPEEDVLLELLLERVLVLLTDEPLEYELPPE